MKINDQIISIPPYISTTWDEVRSLFLDKEGLIILLKNDLKIRIPIQDDAVLHQIFDSHKRYLENSTNEAIQPASVKQGLNFDLPFKLGKLDDLEMLGQAMLHNPDQSDAADIPPDILEKISKVSDTLGLSLHESIPQAEPHCNCMYCQLARAITGEKKEIKNSEVKVTDEELTFRDWDIKQQSELVYHVTNPLDVQESYDVFLGNPLGCTCGNKNCEHIRTVLNS